jgi:hypothetical protein
MVPKSNIYFYLGYKNSFEIIFLEFLSLILFPLAKIYEILTFNLNYEIKSLLILLFFFALT